MLRGAKVISVTARVCQSGKLSPPGQAETPGLFLMTKGGKSTLKLAAYDLSPSLKWHRADHNKMIWAKTLAPNTKIPGKCSCPHCMLSYAIRDYSSTGFDSSPNKSIAKVRVKASGGHSPVRRIKSACQRAEPQLVNWTGDPCRVFKMELCNGKLIKSVWGCLGVWLKKLCLFDQKRQ